MSKFKKFIALLFLLIVLNVNFALGEITEPAKYPDYAYEYLGNDKLEGFNRKMFTFNSKLNKYALKPLHILGA